MSRKRTKSQAEKHDAVETAPGGSSSSLPQMTWGELVARAEADLDEKGRESYAKATVAAEKHVRRATEAGKWFEPDVGGVQKVLVAYYEKVTGAREDYPGFKQLFAKFGVRFDDYSSGRKGHAEFGMVMEYVRRIRNDLAREEAMELVSDAQEAQKRLVTEDGCELNQRAVELSLKATMRDVYGDGDDKKDAEKRKPIIYNLPGLTLNMIMSPAELAAKKLDGKKLASEVIDV